MRSVPRSLLALLFAAVALGSGGARAQDPATAPRDDEPVFRFSVDVRTVYVDVFVKRDGRPVPGLAAEDFEVRDNGVPQRVELVDAGDLPLTTLLLLDASGSLAGERLRELRAAAHAFAERLGEQDEVGLVTFADEIRLDAPLGVDVAGLHRALERPRATGETSLYDAVYAGLKLVETRAGRPLVVLFTDGLDNASWTTASEVLDAVRRSEAVVYVVGYRPRTATVLSDAGRFVADAPATTAASFLESLSGTTGGRTWYLDGGTPIRDAFLAILAEMQSRYLVAFRPEGPMAPGWHELDVRVRGGRADEVRARRGYLVREGGEGDDPAR